MKYLVCKGLLDRTSSNPDSNPAIILEELEIESFKLSKILLLLTLLLIWPHVKQVALAWAPDTPSTRSTLEAEGVHVALFSSHYGGRDATGVASLNPAIQTISTTCSST